MKVRTSISLPGELLEAVDRQAAGHESRSHYIETAIRARIDSVRRDETDNDLAILNKKADQLNREAADVLAYQVIP